MAATASRTDTALWARIKRAITEGDKGGHPGQWSARKAQLATAEYKKQGGGYAGRKSADNHLSQWTEEKWDTRSGQPSGKTGERYLPEAARARLSDDEYDRTTAKKRSDSKAGRQHSPQPDAIADKTASARHDHALSRESLAALRRQAAERGIAGRSRMRKPELVAALSRPG